MAATVSVSETNSSDATITASVTSLNFGSTDQTNLTAATYPITAGTRSYEKWVRFNVTAMGGSTYVNNFKVWMSSSMAAGCEIRTNATSTTTTALVFPTSSGPSNISRESTYYYNVALTTAIPTAPNVNIGGVGSSSLAAAGYSDYVVFQLAASSVAAIAGQTLTLSFQYDEVA
jgi:hypothetical protein